MSIELKIPSAGESITEVVISEWLKNEGDFVEKDENLVVVETDKANMEIPAPEAGTLAKIVKAAGETVSVGGIIARLESGGAKKAPGKKKTAKKSEPAAEQKESEPHIMPAAQRLMDDNGLGADEVEGTGPGGRVLKEDVQRAIEQSAASAPQTTAAPIKEPAKDPTPASIREREEEIVPMTPLRRAIAKNLVQAQQNAALLTTFNEVDMSAIKALRKQYQERFTQRYGIKLGFMSFFIKAVIDALKQFPSVNAEIRGTDIVYKNYYDVGVAVGGGKGLVVPIVRDADHLSFSELETAIAELAGRARDNKLKLEELQGGTFTITNGGIYGSMMSTPIVNPPQSGILGMHAIQDRPMAVNGEVVIRPMMYIALTYDHRVVDGREAVTFLTRVKDAIEAPARMLLEV